MTGKRTAVVFLMIAVVSAAGAILWLGRSHNTGQQEPAYTGTISPPPSSSTALKATSDAGKSDPSPALELRGRVEAETQIMSPQEPVYENRAVRNVTPDRLTRSREVTGPLKRIKSAIRKPEKPKRAGKAAVRRPVITAAGYLENAKKQRFDLAHIDALEEDAECTLASGEKWPCGTSARTALRRLVRGRTVTCTADKTDRGADKSAETDDEKAPMVFTCRIGNIEINRWLVAYGWARPAEKADNSYANLEKTAKEQGRGQWRQSAPQPLRSVVVSGSVGNLVEDLGAVQLETADIADPDDIVPLPDTEASGDLDAEQTDDDLPVSLDWQEPNIFGDLQ